MTGPVGIAQQVGTVFWDLGPIYLLYIAALLSANLALVNILPFPPLDGGRVLFLLIRRGRGQPLQRAGRAADLPRRVRAADGLPRLDHLLRRDEPGVGQPMTEHGAHRLAGRHDAAPISSGRGGGRPSASTSAGVLGRLGPSDRRPVDDQHRYGRRRRDGDPGRPARPRRQPARPDHGQQRAGRGGRARDHPEGPRPGRRRAGDRRLPLQRPPAPRALPGDRRGPGQVPDQPGQRRCEAPRRALPDDRPDRDRQRQAGPDRGELGLARPGPADRADGGQRPARRTARLARRDDRRDARVGDALGRAGRGDRAWATTGSSSAPRSRACAT